MRKLTAVPLFAGTLAACGPHRMTPVAPADWPVAPESRVKILWSGVGNTEQIGIALSSTKDTLFSVRTCKPTFGPSVCAISGGSRSPRVHIREGREAE